VRRELVAELVTRYGASRRQVCRALGFPRATDYYESRKDPQDALRVRLRDLAAARVKYGYRRLHVLLRREGWAVNKKRVLRLYQQEGLALRRKSPRRRASARTREGRPPVEAADQVWAMDFVSVALADGRKARVLTVLDVFTREAVAVRADARFTAGMVVRVLEELAYLRGVPTSLRVDNGPEFAGKMLDLWAYFNHVTLDFSRPGKPTDNAFIESFNGRLRQECLDPHWFTCLDDLRAKTEDWRREYNEDRPHSALGNLAPGEFAAKQAGKTEPGQPSKLA
jgi:putative transposase